MGSVVTDDGSVLPVAGTFAGAVLTVSGVIVPGGDLSQLLNNGDCYLLEIQTSETPLRAGRSRRQFSAALPGWRAGEEGVIQAEDASGSTLDDFLGLLRAHRIRSRMSKIASIPA